jgi:hypothetical protein
MTTDRGAAGGALYNHREKDLYHRRESRVLPIVKYILHPYRFLDENMVQTVLVSLRKHIKGSYVAYPDPDPDGSASFWEARSGSASK